MASGSQLIPLRSHSVNIKGSTQPLRCRLLTHIFYGKKVIFQLHIYLKRFSEQLEKLFLWQFLYFSHGCHFFYKMIIVIVIIIIIINSSSSSIYKLGLMFSLLVFRKFSYFCITALALQILHFGFLYWHLGLAFVLLILKLLLHVFVPSHLFHKLNVKRIQSHWILLSNSSMALVDVCGHSTVIDTRKYWNCGPLDLWKDFFSCLSYWVGVNICPQGFLKLLSKVLK